jgi:hypothetical protein
MKTTHILPFVLILFFIACSDGDAPERGTITFTATHDCDIRLLDSIGRQIARQNYEVGRAPVIFYVNNPGLFFVCAVTVGNNKTYKEPFTYHSGHIEHYIEF